MQIIDLDCSLFKPQSISLILKANTRSLTQSLNGNEQVISGRRAVWHASLRFRLTGKDRIPLYRAVLAELEGRTNALRFCVCDPFGFTPKDASANLLGTPYSDDTPHSDEAGFAFEPVLETTMPSQAGMNSLTFASTGFPSQGVRVGCYFSVNDFLYIITKITSGLSMKLEFKPPLRQAILAGDAISLKAHTVMRLTDDMQGQHTIRLGRYMEEVSLDLVEVFGR
jgi:hypothetical protein